MDLWTSLFQIIIMTALIGQVGFNQRDCSLIENNQYKWLGHKKAVVKDCFF